MTTPILWQFSYSHDCELARWALDHKAIPWVRRNLLPGLHVPRVLALSGQREVPVLQLDGRVVVGALAIVEALEALRPAPALLGATPAEEAAARALATRCTTALGPALQRVVFDALFDDPRYCALLLSVGQGHTRRIGFRAALRALVRPMRRALKIHREDLVQEAQALLGSELDALDARVVGRTDGAPLIGGRLSWADLAAAAMVSPLLPPASSPYRLQRRCPARFEALRAHHVERPSVRWAAALYGARRGASMAENGELRGAGVI